MAKFKPDVCELTEPPDLPDQARIVPERAFRGRADLQEGISGHQGIGTEFENTDTSHSAVLAPRSSFRDEDAPDTQPSWSEHYERKFAADDWANDGPPRNGGINY